MGRLSIRKGKDWEREVVRRLKAVGQDAERNLTETREGNTGDVHWPGWVAQCKTGKAPPVWDAFLQAEASAQEGETPVAILHRDGRGGRRAIEVAALKVEGQVARWLDCNDPDGPLSVRYHGEGTRPRVWSIFRKWENRPSYALMATRTGWPVETVDTSILIIRLDSFIQLQATG